MTAYGRLVLKRFLGSHRIFGPWKRRLAGGGCRATGADPTPKKEKASSKNRAPKM